MMRTASIVRLLMRLSLLNCNGLGVWSILWSVIGKKEKRIQFVCKDNRQKKEKEVDERSAVGGPQAA